jgi:hypothetical protein
VNSELKVLRTHDDSRPAKPLPSFALDRAAKIRIGAKRAKAQHELLQGLIDYLAQDHFDIQKKSREVPTAEALLPYFQRYATAMYDAEIVERLSPPLLSPTEPHTLEKVLNQIVQDVCGRKGIWVRAVTTACRAVSGKSPRDAYGAGALVRPRRAQLAARVLVHAKQWQHDMWKRASEKRQPTKKASSKTSSALPQMEFPGRAAWLKGLLEEAELTPDTFHDKRYGGPDPKTTKLVRYGQRVGERALTKIYLGLSKTLGRTIVRSDIPDN